MLSCPACVVLQKGPENVHRWNPCEIQKIRLNLSEILKTTWRNPDKIQVKSRRPDGEIQIKFEWNLEYRSEKSRWNSNEIPKIWHKEIPGDTIFLLWRELEWCHADLQMMIKMMVVPIVILIGDNNVNLKLMIQIWNNVQILENCGKKFWSVLWTLSIFDLWW